MQKLSPGDKGLNALQTVAFPHASFQRMAGMDFSVMYLQFLRGGGLQNGLRLNSHDLIWIIPAEGE